MQRLKLLIVDDEPAIVGGLRRMIQDASTIFSNVATATDAYDALEQIESFAPDLVFTDIQMPEMDGLEFIEAARGLGFTRFVILTGYDRFDYARQAIRLHVRDFLLKPIQYTELVEVLNRNALEILEDRARVAVVPAENGSDQGGSTVIRRFKAYLHDHFMYDISLDNVATHLGLHPNYVCNVVKRETGMTFVRYLRSIRIEKAKELLRLPDHLTVDQVAHSVGYQNSRTFYKVFKEVTGTTPGSAASRSARP